MQHRRSPKHADEELRESRQLLKLVLDCIPVRVFWKDRNLNYLGCNRPFALDAGLPSPEAIIGKSDYQMGWAEQAERYRADDRLVIESGTPKLNYEEPQTTPDGRRIWLRTSKVPMIDSTGQVRGVMGTYEDITERKRAEEALRESEERYRRYFEQSLAAHCVTDLEGRILVCNPAFLRMFGFSSALEAARTNVVALYPSAEARKNLLETLRTKNRVDQYEMELCRLDGTPVHIIQNAVGVFDEKGQMVEIHSYQFDDTKRWKIERQFMQAQKMEAVGRLTAGVAHDFNNVLSIINGYSDLLLEQTESEESHRRVTQIRQAGERAAALTRQLLAFSRQQVLEPRIVDLNEVVRGSAGLICRLIGEDIKLNVVLSRSPCPVKVDMTQIEQAIMNLFVNARDAMPNGGEITIEVNCGPVDETFAAQQSPIPPGKYAMLTVSDTGVGMDADTRSHLFEPYFTTKEQGKGTGLGLATVYGIVKQSGGHIGVNSELGKGTTFHICLPLLEKLAETIPSAEAPRESRPCTETILLVEDEPFVREVTREMLIDAGFKVLEAASAAEAETIAETHKDPIALLLTDVMMPNTSGPALAGRLVPMRPGMKVLCMSGYADDAVIDHGGPPSGLAFIQKPFSRDTLARKIREILDQQSASSA